MSPEDYAKGVLGHEIGEMSYYKAKEALAKSSKADAVLKAMLQLCGAADALEVQKKEMFFRRKVLRNPPNLKGLPGGPGTEPLIRSTHALMGLCGELGELVEATYSLDRLDILKEAGDVLFYLTLLLDDNGIGLSEVMEQNLRKLDQRKQANAGT